MKSAVLHEHACHGAHTLIELGFDYGAARLPVRVGEKFLHLGYEQHVFEQVIYALAGLCRYGAYDGISAPFLGQKAIVGEVLLYLIYICALFIHLVDRNDDGYVGGFGVVDGFYRLGHYAVVGSYNEDYYIGNLCAARPHCSERLVTGGIEESYLFISHRNRISAYVLGYAARFAFGDVGLSYIVEKGGLAVVYVTHYRYDGSAGNEAFNLFHGIGLLFRELLFRRLFGLVFKLYAEVGGNHKRRFVVNRAVYSGNYAVFEQALGDFHRGYAQLFGKDFDGDIIGSYDGVVDFYRLNGLLGGLLGAHLAVYAPLVVEVLYAGALLTLQRALVHRLLFLFYVCAVALLFIRPEVLARLGCGGCGGSGTHARGTGSGRPVCAERTLCGTTLHGAAALLGTGRTGYLC